MTQFGNGRKSGKFQRWYERLQTFTYTLEYHPGKSNHVADALSRLNSNKTSHGVPDPTIRRVTKAMADNSLTWEGFQAATMACPESRSLAEFIKTRQPAKLLPQHLAMYKAVLSELHLEGHVIMRDDRIVVPASLRRELLKQAHVGHPGITRTKRKLRTTYWWPNMDAAIEESIKTCMPCERSEKSQPRSPYQTTVIPRPKEPWEKLAIDVTGPFATAPINSKYTVVLIDYHSSYPEILWTNEATAETVIDWLMNIFARFGNPSQLVSDNGPQFTSSKFTNFLANRGIRHLRTPNYNPQRNGFVERFNKTLKTSTQTFSGPADWKRQSLEFLATFRATQLSSGMSPSQLLFGGRINRLPYEYCRRNTSTDESHDTDSNPSQIEATQQIDEGKDSLRGKLRHPGPFRKGDKVRVKLPHVLKGQSPYSEPREVKKVLGFWTYELSDGKTWNARRLKRHHPPSDEDVGVGTDDLAGRRYNLRANPRKTNRLLYSERGTSCDSPLGSDIPV